MAKVFNKFINILLIIIISVLSIGLILRALDKMNIYNIESGSMESKIHVGDYVLIYKTNDYSVGDIVTYKVNNYFVTHRIVKIENEKVTTKGDANNTTDDEINLNQIEGEVIYCGGILNYVINYRFVIAAILIGLYLLNSCIIEKKEKVNKK